MSKLLNGKCACSENDGVDVCRMESKIFNDKRVYRGNDGSGVNIVRSGNYSTTVMLLSNAILFGNYSKANALVVKKMIVDVWRTG